MGVRVGKGLGIVQNPRRARPTLLSPLEPTLASLEADLNLDRHARTA